MFKIIPNQQTPRLQLIKDDCKEWVKENKKLLNSFIDFASSIPTAVGLASNQVELEGKRLTDPFIAIKRKNKWIIAINPKFRPIGPQHKKIEGCLTWGPDKMLISNRFESIMVSYIDINGDPQKETIEDPFEAQVWQHEINHIFGIKEIVKDRAPVPYTRESKKIGRNDLCPCGSGKKYKKCHLGIVPNIL